MIKQTEKTQTKKFNKVSVRIYRCDDNQVYYNTEDVAKAVEYTKTSGIDYHLKNTHYDVTIQNKSGGYVRVLHFDGIAYVSVKANRTPMLKIIRDWAFDISYPKDTVDKNGVIQLVEINPNTFAPTINGSVPLMPIKQQYGVKVNNEGHIAGFGINSDIPVLHVNKLSDIQASVGDIKPKKRVRKSRSKAYVAPEEENFGIKETAEKLGINTVQLSDWLIENGFANRYKGNNALYLEAWFKEQKYGLNPVLPADNVSGERISNVPRITESGVTFIRNRMKNERETNLQVFTKTVNEEKQVLTSQMDDLILNTFKRHEDSPGFGFYSISYVDLIKRVKEVVAQVVVK